MNKMINRQCTMGVFRPLSVLLAVSMLAACSGGSSVTSTPSGPTNPGTDPGTDPGTNPGPVLADPKLTSVAADSVIRTAMLDYYTNPRSDAGGLYVDTIALPVALESTVDSADSATSDGSGGQTRFSDTNVQESGVDESDRVKIDGNVMFALERPDSNHVGIFPVFAEDAALTIAPYNPPVETLSAYQLDKENSQKLSRLKLDSTPSGMYLHKNGGNRDLVMLSSGSFDWSYWSYPALFANGQTKVTWIDATDAGNLSVGRTLSVDGQMISSRKIDNQLILVTRYHPYIDGIIEPYSDDVIAANRRIIEATDQASLMPGYSLESGGNTVTGDVISDNQCYKNATSSADQNNDTASDVAIPYYESPSIISIITIDLNDQSTSIKNTCFVGQSETMYVSQNALYLATTQYDYNISVDSQNRPAVDYYPPEITTEVHKFAFRNNSAPDFRGSASVSGHLGWVTDRKPFRMSEKDGRLRIVTFDENRSGSPVTLNILEESGGEVLNTIATLPNENRPDPIGKPNENLYASRFIGDRAYLVTFRITDPLYVLDVSDPYDPYIAGELELPGYSDYLHPVSDDLLLGVGKDAIAADGTGWGDGRGAFYQGVKLALFDVSDPAAPSIADTRIIGKRGTDSPALYQHHSFAYLPEGNGRNARMAIPLSLHDEQPRGSGPSAWADWTSNNMLKMEVDVPNATFVDAPDWVFESRAAGHTYSPVGLQNDRAVIGSDGGLYVIHNGALQYGLWDDAAPLSSTE